VASGARFQLPDGPSTVSNRDHFLQADFLGPIRTMPNWITSEWSAIRLGISVRLQVERKQFIGNGHLIGSSLR
jgi:hypothetical protein